MRSYSNLPKKFNVRSFDLLFFQKNLHFSVRYQSVPIVIVFTQYDRLVRTKRAELKEDNQFMSDETLNSRSVEEAWKAFEICLQSLQRTMRRLGIGMPPYARVSGIFVPLHNMVVLTAC